MPSACRSVIVLKKKMLKQSEQLVSPQTKKEVPLEFQRSLWRTSSAYRPDLAKVQDRQVAPPGNPVDQSG